MKHSITMGEKVGYSLGDVAANLAFQMMMIYQLKFYTDIFGLDGAIAGTVLLIAPLASAFIDPFIGLITDRTNTRWGKYRPWLIWTALPFCVFYVLAFWNPGIEDKGLVAVYATVSYLLLLTMYGFNNTPYASLGGVITNDIQERTSINKVRFICTSILGSYHHTLCHFGFCLPRHFIPEYQGADPTTASSVNEYQGRCSRDLYQHTLACAVCAGPVHLHRHSHVRFIRQFLLPKLS